MSDPVDQLADKVEDNEEGLDFSLKKKKKKKAAPVESSPSEESTEPKSEAGGDETAAPAKKKVIKIIKKVIKKVPAGTAVAAAASPADSTAEPSAATTTTTTKVVKKVIKKVAAPAADSETAAAPAPAKKVVKKAAPAVAEPAAAKAAPKKKVAKKSVTFGENTSSKPEDNEEIIEGFVKRPEDDFYTPYVSSKSADKTSAKKQIDWMTEDDEEEGNNDDDDEEEREKKAKAESAQDDDADDDDDDEFNFSKMKKKKKKPAASDDADSAPKDEDEDDGISFEDSNKNDEQEAVFKETWLGSDREYRYEELLGRIYHLMSEFNPDMIKSKNRYVIRPPQVFRDGTKKSVWANFNDICNEMHRPIDHVLAYSKAELGTTASIDGNNRMVIKGRFQPRQIESVVRHYIAEYVSCRTCKSPDTILKKENRLHFMQCKSCGSTRSVAPIKAGFQAQIGHRIKT